MPLARRASSWWMRYSNPLSMVRMPGIRHGIGGAPARSRATNSVHPLAFSTARRSSGQR